MNYRVKRIFAIVLFFALIALSIGLALVSYFAYMGAYNVLIFIAPMLALFLILVINFIRKVINTSFLIFSTAVVAVVCFLFLLFLPKCSVPEAERRIKASDKLQGAEILSRSAVPYLGKDSLFVNKMYLFEVNVGSEYKEIYVFPDTGTMSVYDSPEY